MSKVDFIPGHAKVEDYFWFINERHRIYLRRQAGEPKPWTEDKVLQQYKFTNVFRQLDRGTVALHEYILKEMPTAPCLADMDMDDAKDILWNILWYRYFNLDVHAKAVGWIRVDEAEKLFTYIRSVADRGEKVFTSAWMTTGVLGEPKHETYIRCCKQAMAHLEDVVAVAYHDRSMKAVWKRLQQLPLVGSFLAYEVACDMRFTPLLCDATDVLTWANIGPGARRGMLRLGLPSTVTTMVDLYNMAPNYLAPHLLTHYGDGSGAKQYPPFEMREIEHCLCEFDKMQRVKCGEGRPRERFPGTP